MKKGVLSIFVSILFSISLVSADILSSIENEANARFSALGSTDIIMMYFSIFCIIFILSSIAIKKIPAFRENKAVIIIVSLIIGILAIKFMSQQQILQGILIPYGLIGLFVTYFMPFVILFFLMHGMNFSMFARRMTWLFYAGVMIYLFIKEYPMLNQTRYYTFIISFALIAIAFLLDKWIHKPFQK